MTTVVVNENKAPEIKTEERPLVQVPRRKKTAVTVPADSAPIVVHAEPIIASTVEAGRFVQLTSEIATLMKQGMRCYYEIGVRLKVVRDEQLFSFGAYKSFEDYAFESFGLSQRHASRYVDIATEFTSEEVEQLGSKKCMLIAEARQELRPALKDEASKTPSLEEKRDLRAEIKVAKANGDEERVAELNLQLHRGSRRALETQIRGRTTLERETQITPSEKRITMVTREGLFAHALKDRVTDKPATIESLKTQPAYAVIVHENQTEQLVVVYIDENTNELKLKVACKKTK